MGSRRAGPTSVLACAVLLGAAAAGCSKESWRVTDEARARDADVAAALGDTRHQSSTDFAASDIPDIRYPRALRPCCVFGADYEVEIGKIRVPGVEFGNLLGPKDVGPHRYDNGFLSINTADPRGYLDNENNGLIYTCRGGFIDTAHVRDNADNTIALTAQIARVLETGGVVEVPPQGATMRLRLRPVPVTAIEKYERMRLSTAMAQWAAYQFSIWHEIATFYGYASLAEWPEKISAFSLEDYYSNQIGIRIAGGVILSKGARSDLEYAANLDAWIKRTLERLIAVPLADSRAAMSAVDGLWWDSQKRIPDWTFVKRRQFDPGHELRPWVLEDASPGAKGPVKPLKRCADAGEKLVFRIPDGFSGVPYRDYMTVEFDVHDTLAEGGFPFPRADSRLVTQEDFPFIIEAARRATLEHFGAGADRP